MATKREKREAEDIRDKLADNIPSCLRLPLDRVIYGTEKPGTAKGVIEYAKSVLENKGERYGHKEI